ncbi:MAG TPA: TPM domain-containing protein [Tabrizicola sp.]|nr:TPM domain-containing protein [Tabrizicola sp.]
MTSLRNLTAAILILPFIALSSGAQEAQEPAYPEPISDTVSDFASALDATEEGRISRSLADIRQATGAPIVVVTVPGLDAVNGTGMRLEDFGTALFNAWGIGSERDDGVLILIDTNLREARIALGEGYAPVYDDRAARVLATSLLPELRDGRLAAGIEAGIIAARDRLVLPQQAGTPIGPLDGFETEGSGPSIPVSWLAGGAAALFGLFFWRRHRSRKLCPNCGAYALKRTREVISAPTKFQDGLGLQHLTCTACGFVDRQQYTVRYAPSEGRRSRDDRSTAPEKDTDEGGFGGGFGGGKSGGGGAGTKW